MKTKLTKVYCWDGKSTKYRTKYMENKRARSVVKEFRKKFGEEIHSITKVGGYYYWDWSFPFRHFRKEELYIATGTTLLRLKVK